MLAGGENPEGMDIAKQNLAIAIVTDNKIAASPLPLFGRNDVSQIADFIEERFLRGERSAKVSMLVDGKRVPMKTFVRDLVDSVIRGMVSTFKGTEDAKKITVFLDK